MTLDYPKLHQTATQMIELMGRSAALRPIAGGSDITVTALMSHYGAREREGALIAHDDRRALIASVAGIPAPDPEKHRLVLDGKPLRIVTVRTVCPAMTALYYDCQVRG